ncbi:MULTISPECIES: lysine--tRNA ligase [Pseudonocardia]|uniref:Lysine--tRNA ligase n=2 Tax=Pseudonocardia TaxID=1847 RepID=A0A1Y2MXU7_PSEAH|nr:MULTISPECIES: lysine--tRNA ligase [Pseudonocardia]OSY39799.1 Lysylphosphatidylglycerol biosynthesis bifunctional protein LysX [Pseudonocardia autotrophica]TDN74395.1 lysyl-tRNA synthetase class II [Pseudonocardia autotrophica]BBG05162.1 lysine--tRNA ligase [Pseudonocardia autotrophica]GEC28119.1 lysine--tRNA ligase [Pseudonocardia saturnea]
MNTPGTPSDPGSEADLPEQLRVRRAKRADLLAAGTEPYPVEVPRTHTLRQVRDAHPDLPADTATGETVAVAGRVIFVRNTGKLCFATLREGDGTELQAMLSLDRVGLEELTRWKSVVDLGDFVLVRGEVITSRRGELSVQADEWSMVSKSVRPLPTVHKELSEENRVRQRYVDLIVRPQARETVRSRSAVLRTLREALTGRDFVEVETPMLQLLHGGATARPFVTHANALGSDLYLRIAPELFLKRCVVGGIERVFELNRVFRNEGIDSTHSPEFAMLEAYQAYATYDDMAVLTRELIQSSARALFGSTTVRHHDGTEHDLGGEWRSITLYGAVSEAVGRTVSPDTELSDLQRIAAEHDVDVTEYPTAAQIVLELFEKLVEHTLTEPTFVRDFPVEVRPLTRAHRDDPRLSESWDLIVFGVELATAYSELVDPVEQRERLQAQSLKAAAGDPEAMQLDEDFLRAMEYGMPPTGGLGMGVDRLLMTLTGLGIRETILFPLVRGES